MVPTIFEPRARSVGARFSFRIPQLQTTGRPLVSRGRIELVRSPVSFHVRLARASRDQGPFGVARLLTNVKAEAIPVGAGSRTPAR